MPSLALFVSLPLLLSPLAPVEPPALAPVAPIASRDLSSSKQKSLAKQFRSYLRAKDEKARAKVWKKAKRNAGKASFEQLEAVLRASYPGDAYQAGFTKGVEFSSRDRKWTYTVHMPSKKPTELLPLVIDIGHSTVTDVEGVMNTWMDIAGAKESVIYVRTDVLNGLYASKDYDQWSAFRSPAGKPNMDTLASVLLDAIADAAKRFPVDPDRVYVQGISQTGFWAWYLGMFAPNRFATVIPVASRTLHVRHYPESFMNARVHILHGTADNVCPFADAELMEGKLKEAGVECQFTRVANGPHMGITFGKWRDVWPTVSKQKRETRYPKKIAATLLSPQRRWVEWLEVEGMEDTGFRIGARPGKVEGEIKGQEIQLTLEGPKKATVWLSSEMLDLSKKFGIVVNGKPIFVGKAKKAPLDALESLRKRGDAGAVYSAKVSFEVPE